jgi:tetratricopeptide (TPR) repeat protein
MGWEGSGRRLLVTGLALAALAAVGRLWAADASLAQTLSQANAALQTGQADKALALIGSLPDAGASNALAQNLVCRVNFTMQLWSVASNACAKAVRLEPHNSNYHLWYGRALGEQAHHASFLTAFSLGKQVRVEFETAVQLNPRNAEALSDMGSFYVDAPSMMGGGLDKAENIARQLDKLDPARAAKLRAEIAEDQKDYGAAERELKLAIAASPHPALQWTSLAALYERRERWTEMEAAIRSAANAAARDRMAAVALYDGAGVLLKAKRDPELAAKMLEDYLASPSQSEEAPVFVAHSRLGRLKQELGDSAGARQERIACEALAREYKPPAQDTKS